MSISKGATQRMFGRWLVRRSKEGKERRKREKDSEQIMEEYTGYRSASASSSGSLNFSIAAFISPISALDGFRSSAIEK